MTTQHTDTISDTISSSTISSTITDTTNIGIAGAGLLGRLLAFKLNALGHQVTLYEQGNIQHSRSAAYTAAAMISPMSEVVVSERAIYDIGMQSLRLWPEIIQALPAHFSSLYKANGSIVVAHGQDDSELEQFHHDLNYHLGEHNNSQWLNVEQLRSHEPDIGSHFTRGLYLPNEAFLDNRVFLDNLLDYLLEQGVTLVEQCGVTFGQDGKMTFNDPAIHNPKQNSHNSHSNSHNKHTNVNQHELWFDCRGMGAKTDSPVRGVRGEVIWVETSEVAITRPLRLMHPRYKLYVVPKAGNKYILGATEIESDDDSPMSVQSALELCSALYSINPAFAEARILEIDTNLRPSLRDNMPCIKQATYTQNDNQKQINAIHINGLYRHGYLLAPTLVEHALSLAGLQPNNTPFEDVLSRTTL